MTSGIKGTIRIGIGGWTYPPWRGLFYPEGLPQKEELDYASRHLTSIEINGTYYRTQTAASFARWHDATPEDFVFSVKGPRYATNRPLLAEAASSIERFFTSGVMALKDKLGPVNWQLPPTKSFSPDDLEAFLKLLPASVEGRPIRHAVEARHDSFRTAEFVALLRRYGAAAVVTDKAGLPLIPDVTGQFVYVRLQQCAEAVPTGYTPAALDRWAARAGQWATGALPADLPAIAEPAGHASAGREVFLYLINGFKPKAPAAAMALIERLEQPV